MDIQWDEIFRFSMSPIELMIRGTIMYWFIFILMRAAGRRDVGSLGIADLLVVVLVADAAQNAMAGDYKSLPDGMALVATIVLWSWAIDRIAYFCPRLRPFFEPPKLCIVKDGQIQRREMRRESMTIEQLESELRQHEVTEISHVKRAFIEPDGSISVIKRENLR